MLKTDRTALFYAAVISLGGFLFGFDAAVISGVSWVVQFIFPWELSYLGNAGTFLAYAVFAGVCLALLFWLLPETRGHSLEQLERDLAINPT